MFYKLANTAQLEDLEKEFNAKFEFANLYKPTSVINGLVESTLPIITMEKPSKISFGIWGLLPQALEENWKIFQDLTNTLNINVDHLDLKESLYAEGMDKRRCLILTTGFFTSALYEGKMYPYHVYLKDHKPFAIAGIYNRLEDGFITCSILVKKTNDGLKEVPHFLEYKPVILSLKDREHWLNDEFEYENLKDLVHSPHLFQFESEPVSKDFYDNDMLFNKLVDENGF